MGLTDDCETAIKLATRCKNWQILTVIRKKGYSFKKTFCWENQKRNKNDKIPRARIWTLTTDRNMVQSDALPTELRGTCQLLNLNF